MKNIVALVLFILLLSVGIASHAQTPDGMTPSEETACDGLVGAAYGLCNAYCEAMDCDSAYPKASESACAKVEANFLNKTGQMLPCILEGCENPRNDGQPCDDMSGCTIGDTCIQGICLGDAVDCDDGNFCTFGSCVEPGVCVYENLDQLPCEDGDDCTVGDSCFEGACVPGPLSDDPICQFP